MTTYWANFAARGDPNGEGLPEWPAFDPKAKIVLQLGDNTGRIPAATDARFEFYRRYFASHPKPCSFADGCSIGMQ
jgi:carboxylesterase type B